MTLVVNQTSLKIIGKYFNIFVNESGEIIIIPELNIFINGNFTNDDDLKVKTINSLSRCVNYYVLTRGQRETFLRMCNEILGKQLSCDDWDLIYRKLGNAINPSLTTRFIESNYDMKLLGSTNLF
ncbi:MAG: hypothetical protein H9W83_00645 [Leuconostoc sp.]|nr:hypothetical protein [Leuconostoc sp.]